MHVYVRTIPSTKCIQSAEKRKVKPRRRSGLGMDMYLCAKFHGVSLRQKRRGHYVLVRKICVFYVFACDYFVLV